MRVRALTATGDYAFGHGAANYLINSSAAVAQLVATGLRLMEGEWFLDNTVGTPWLQKVIGTNTKPFYDLAIQNQILNTVGVKGIVSYSSSLDAKSRHLTVGPVTIDTIFGQAVVAAIILTPHRPRLDFQVPFNTQYLPGLLT